MMTIRESLQGMQSLGLSAATEPGQLPAIPSKLAVEISCILYPQVTVGSRIWQERDQGNQQGSVRGCRNRILMGVTEIYPEEKVSKKAESMKVYPLV